MNIGDRGPAPSFYDPPREPETWPCNACDGTGWLCLKGGPCRDVLPVTGVRVVSAICQREHRCPICHNTGEVSYTNDELREMEDDHKEDLLNDRSA